MSAGCATCAPPSQAVRDRYPRARPTGYVPLPQRIQTSLYRSKLLSQCWRWENRIVKSFCAAAAIKHLLYQTSGHILRFRALAETIEYVVGTSNLHLLRRDQVGGNRIRLHHASLLYGKFGICRGKDGRRNGGRRQGKARLLAVHGLRRRALPTR